MFSFNTGLALKRCDYVRFSVRLWLSYGSDELVQSGEMNQFTYVSQSGFIFYNFGEPSKGTVWFLLRSGSEPMSQI